MSRHHAPLVTADIERQRERINNRRRILDQLVIGEVSMHAAAESMRALHASLYADEGLHRKREVSPGSGSTPARPSRDRADSV